MTVAATNITCEVVLIEILVIECILLLVLIGFSCVIFGCFFLVSVLSFVFGVSLKHNALVQKHEQRSNSLEYILFFACTIQLVASSNLLAELVRVSSASATSSSSSYWTFEHSNKLLRAGKFSAEQCKH